MLTAILTALLIGLVIGLVIVAVAYLINAAARLSSFYAVSATFCFAGLALGGSWWLLLAGFVNVAMFALHAWQDAQEDRDEAAEAAETV